jgi:UPF0716 protein FxsA
MRTSLVDVIALLLIGWFVVELFVVIEVAGVIGIGATILLLILSWPLGAWALRAQGRAAWRRLSAAVAAGRSPGREVLDGVLVLVGGLLLIVPGFISDVLGALALLPPTRALLRRPLARNLQSRFVVTATRFGNASGPYDVDSTATDVDQAQLRP